MPIERIHYTAGSLPCIGALVHGANVPRDAPLLLVSTNWSGLGDDALRQAEQIARHRYVVFVADMYGNGKVAGGHEEAASLANAVRGDTRERRLRIGASYAAMLDAARARNIGDTRRTAAVGFCFGGGNVLELARAGAPLSAAISLHGDLTSPEPATPGSIKPALLVLHGGADPVAPKAQRDAFEAEMDAAGADWSMLTFGGVLHSFAEEGPTVPGVAEYHARSARLSFGLVDHFLDEAWKT
ncbi:MAG: hypothetical protein JWL93_357 [Hyphomicrobiales bacterium]|nr:hypothetical protein [Hyphomicrobiales bacterium]